MFRQKQALISTAAVITLILRFQTNRINTYIVWPFSCVVTITAGSRDIPSECMMQFDVESSHQYSDTS